MMNLLTTEKFLYGISERPQVHMNGAGGLVRCHSLELLRCLRQLLGGKSDTLSA